MRLAQALALLLALSLLLAACGDGNEASDNNANQPATQPTATVGASDLDPTATEETTEGEPADEPVDVSTPEPLDDAEPVDPPAEADTALSPESQDAEDSRSGPDEAEGPAQEASQDEPAEPENRAPEFGTIDNWYNGSPTTLDELRGGPVLLVFWADF